MSERIQFPNFSTDNSCGTCNKCCTAEVAVSIEDVNRIKSYIAENNISVIDRGELCTFWDNGCLVESVKPGVCSLFKCWDLPTVESMVALYEKAIYNLEGGKPITMYEIFKAED